MLGIPEAKKMVDEKHPFTYIQVYSYIIVHISCYISFGYPKLGNVQQDKWYFRVNIIGPDVMIEYRGFFQL